MDLFELQINLVYMEFNFQTGVLLLICEFSTILWSYYSHHLQNDRRFLQVLALEELTVG